MSAEPGVPVIDLPRVDAAQFQFYDHSIGAFLVTADDAMARWIDVLCSAAPCSIAADIETRGLDVNKFTITCVTVCFHLGGDTVALLFDPLRRDNHRRMLIRVFDHASQIVFHGASFDVAPLYAHRLLTRAHIRKIGDTLVAARMIKTYAKAGRTLEDLALSYGVMTDDRITMSEVFAARGLKKDEGWWSTDIDTPTYAIGAMSDTVATLRLWGTPGTANEGIMATAARYLTTAQLGLGGAGVLHSSDAEQGVEDVQQVNRIVLERTARGYAIDPGFPERFLAETAEITRAAANTLKEAGIRPGVGADLVNVLDARGELPQPWPRTDTGRLKADKKALEVFTAEDAVIRSDLVTAHRIVAENEKTLGYVNKVVDNSGPTGRLHPEIKILGASATGRMCLPTSHRLLTRRGIVNSADIRLGDRTLDADGHWTTVRAVHTYDEAPLLRATLACGTAMVCTPEHRWMVSIDGGPEELMNLPRAISVSRLVGGKFSLRLAAVEPEQAALALAAAGSDPATGSDPAYADAHQTGMRLGRYARARAQRFGSGPSLTPSTTDFEPIPAGEGSFRLVQQMLEADPLTAAAVLAGAGSQAGELPEQGIVDIYCGGPQMRDAVAVAAYRVGLHPQIIEGPYGPWVRLQDGGQQVVAVHPQCKGAEVWCVTTDSGTFTAWGEYGPYLTGNSASKPEVQQFPSQARGVIVADDGDWVSADWKSIEPVILATAAGDRQFLDDMRAGKDPYEPVGVMAGIDRKLAKRKMLADMYGQGHNAAALQYGWTVDRAKQVAWSIRDGLPILYRLIDALKAQSERDGCVTTLSGRVVDQQFSFYDNGTMISDVAKRIAPNHFCQGSALDVMHYSILELDRRGLSDHVHLWMHDEIIADATIAGELAEVMATPPPFLEAAARYHGMEAFLAVDLNEMGQRWEYV